MDTNLLSNHVAADVDWLDKMLPQMKDHPAWHGAIDEKTAESLLQGQPAFTYLFRAGKDEHNYLLSFVTRDGTVAHPKVVMTEKVWVYYNGGTWESPYISRELCDLIPVVLRCDPSQCQSLRNL
jgi:hypothetical protein